VLFTLGEGGAELGEMLMLICGDTLGQNIDTDVGRVAREACSAMWNLGTNSAFFLAPRIATENLGRISWSQNLPDAYRLPSRSPKLV
jgi:hypothetical protein